MYAFYEHILVGLGKVQNLSPFKKKIQNNFCGTSYPLFIFMAGRYKFAICRPHNTSSSPMALVQKQMNGSLGTESSPYKHSINYV